jgi:hypothetical protein
MSYTPPTIQEQGGLKKWLLKHDINYELFKQLRPLPGQNYTTIAKALTHDRKIRSGVETKISLRSVKHWCEVDDEEAATITKKN